MWHQWLYSTPCEDWRADRALKMVPALLAALRRCVTSPSSDLLRRRVCRR